MRRKTKAGTKVQCGHAPAAPSRFRQVGLLDFDLETARIIRTAVAVADRTEPRIRLIKEFRNSILFRVAAAYFVSAWLLIQVGDILLDNFGAPDWAFRALVLVLVAAFPLVLIVAWLIDANRKAQNAGRRSRWLGFGLRLVVVLALTAVLVWLGRDALRSGIELVRSDRPPSVAVLPFADMSPDGDQRYFAHGLSEEILNLLAGIEELKVSGRTSSFAFEGNDVSIPQIGDALDVAHVLEGSVRKSGNRVRVTAQLIAAADGFHVWSENYDRELTDIFAIQDEIADAIASQLRLSLVENDGAKIDSDSTSSIEAYEHFLRARQLIQKRRVAGMERARELLDRALTLDPDFAPALAQQALAWLMLSDARTTPGSEPLAAAVTRADELLQRALAANPDLADARAVEGLMLTIKREFDRADRALARALEINPSHSDALNWRAINLRNAGRLRDELEARRRLLEIDPLHLSNLFNLSIAHLLRGQTGEAVAVARRLKRDFPNSPWGHLAELEALLGSGRLAEAHAIAAEQLAGGNSILVSSASSLNMRLGRFEEAIEISGGPFGTALLGLGRVDQAVAAARDAAAAAPDSVNATLMLLEVLSLAGRHEELLAHFETRWGSLDALEAYFGFEDMTAEVAPIAAARAALGRTMALDRTLAHWGQRLADPIEQGYAMPYFRYIQSSHAALSGERDRALELLEAAIEGGYLTPLLDIDPKFDRLRGDPEFDRLVQRNDARIDAERAELGLPALKRPLLPGMED